jgi:hypothetical protein
MAAAAHSGTPDPGAAPRPTTAQAERALTERMLDLLQSGIDAALASR